MQAKSGRKLVSTLAAVIGLIVFAAPSALADGDVAQVGDTTYATFAQALDAANKVQGSATITLIADAPVGGSESLYVTNDMTLVLADYALTIANNGKITISNDVTVTRGTGGIQNLGSIEIAAGKTLNMEGFLFGAGIIDAPSGADVGTFAIKAGAEVILGAGLTPLAMESVNPTFFSGSEAGGKFTAGSKTYTYTGTEWPVWAGAGTAESPYEIAIESDLEALQAWVSAGNVTAGKFWKQTADIEMTKSWSGIGAANSQISSTGNKFWGTYDGNHFAISNVIFSTANYGGFFNWAEDATFKNLEINVKGRDYTQSGSGNGMVVGIASNVVFSSVLVTGVISNEHNTGGFCVKAIDTSFTDCTNRCNIVYAGDKVGGFVGFESSLVGTLTFTRCSNEGKIVGIWEHPGYTDGVLKSDRNGGAGGFIGQCCGATVSFVDCSSTGEVIFDNSLRPTTGDGTMPVQAGTYIGGKGSSNVVTESGCTGDADQCAVGYNYGTVRVDVFDFATTSGDTATFVTPVDGGSYKVMVTNATYTLTTVVSTITLDESLTTASVTAASYLNTPTKTAEGVYSATVKEASEIWSGRGTGTSEDPYQISTETDLFALKALVDGNKATAGVYFKQTANIAMTKVWYGIGVASAGQAAAVTDFNAFRGVYNGNGKSITNLTFARQKYAGFFNTISTGSVISNLTIAVAGFADEGPQTTEWGAAFIGFANGDCVLENLTANNETGYETFVGTHNMAGFVVSMSKGEKTFKNLTNNMNISTTGSKVGGIVMQHIGADTTVYENCVNNGELTATASGTGGGVGGLISYLTGNDTRTVTFKDCSSVGSLNGGTQPTGSLVGKAQQKKAAITIDGTVTVASDFKAVGAFNDEYTGDVSALWFATTSGDTATFCAAAVGGSYKVMATGATFDFTALGQTITLDETLATATVGTTLGSGYSASQSGNVYTCAIANPVAVTVTSKYVTYTVKDGDVVLPFADGAGQVPSGKEVVFTATPLSGLEYATAPSGWTKSGDSITKTYTETAAFAVEIPEPSIIPADVQVADKNGYTNLTFTIKAPSAGSYKIVAKDIETGAEVGTATIATELVEGSQTVDVAIDQFTGGTGIVVGKTYTYTVQTTDGATTVGTATYSDVGWKTNGYFGASAKTGSPVYNNGMWVGEAPTISGNAFAIDSTQQTFKVTTVKQSDDRKIVTLDTEIDIESYYYLDDITNDVTSAIAALALVTNEENAADASWMVLKDGTEWTKMDGPSALGAYVTRIELDYNTATPRVRYSVKPDSTGLWQVLTLSGAEWLDAQANYVSNVCFVGKADVAEFAAELSTKGVAEVNGTDYPDIASALNEAGNGTIVLYTNIKVDPRTLKAGTYTINVNGKTFEANEVTWTKGDGAKTEVTLDGTTLTVVKKLFVAEIGDELYFTLQDALDDAADGTVVVLTNLAECATSTVASTVLDLDGFTLTKGTAGKPVIVVKGADLFVFGGSITGTTDAAAISAESAATVTIDELVLTNLTKAISASGASTVVISNGIFTGAFDVDENVSSKIQILGGYIVAKAADDISFTSAGGKFEAIGGKYTDAASNKVANVSGMVPSTYKFTEFAVAVVTNDYTFLSEIMTNVVDASTGKSVAAKVYSVEQDGGTNTIGGVQISDAWIESHVTATEPAKVQEELSTKISYVGEQTIKKWECYVLGIDPTSSETMKEGPVVKGVQDNKVGTIGFNIMSPELIKAQESGCDVKFEVEEYTDSSLSTPTGKTTGKIDYTKTAELPAPGQSDGVRYYKLKLSISPKK